jgi:hypothetical protein
MGRKILFLLMAVVLMATSCRTNDGLTKAEREALVTRQVQEGLDTRHYTIAVDWMRPLGLRPRHVTSNYELKVNGDEVDSYLPYIGEGHNLPYGGGKALNFKGTIKNYSITYPTSNRSHIEFTVTNVEDSYFFRIDMFSNGKAFIDIIPRERDAISFEGEMVF